MFFKNQSTIHLFIYMPLILANLSKSIEQNTKFEYKQEMFFLNGEILYLERSEWNSTVFFHMFYEDNKHPTILIYLLQKLWFITLAYTRFKFKLSELW